MHLAHRQHDQTAARPCAPWVGWWAGGENARLVSGDGQVWVTWRMRRCIFAARRLDVCVGRSRKEPGAPGAPAAQQQGWEDTHCGRYCTVWASRQGKQDFTVYPGIEVDHAQCSCSCSWCCSWAVPHAHACPCPMPLPHAQDGLLPPIPGRQSSSPHCTRIPSVPKYRVSAATLPTHWLRPHPRRSISHGTRPGLTGHLLAPCLWLMRGP